jgi:histidinol dehydrogenase
LSTAQIATNDYKITSGKNAIEIVRELRSDPERMDVSSQTEKILSQVREGGNKTLLELTNRFDGTDLTDENKLFATSGEFKEAYSRLKPSEIGALRQQLLQIRALSKNQLERFQEKRMDSPLGFRIHETYSSFSRVGGYIPGGLASYPSTVLMVCVPAKEAGVQEILLATPPRRDGTVSDSVLVAADLAGVAKVIKVGGAQAIAAMALGTESIDKVSLIVGPGNDYVTEAKKQLSASGEVMIDSLAGPTELLIVADEKANPYFIAEDLVSQAEHGNRTLCGLVSTSSSLIESVKKTLSTTLPRPRQEYILKSTLFTVLAKTMKDAIEFSQVFASEHLELMVANPNLVYPKLTNSGLVLVGDYAPCSSSDYMVGTNHILPTRGTAANFSGLGVETFLKRVTAVKGTRKSLRQATKYITTLATMEGFPNHAAATRARFDKGE